MRHAKNYNNMTRQPARWKSYTLFIANYYSRAVLDVNHVVCNFQFSVTTMRRQMLSKELKILFATIRAHCWKTVVQEFKLKCHKATNRTSTAVGYKEKVSKPKAL